MKELGEKAEAVSRSFMVRCFGGSTVTLVGSRFGICQVIHRIRIWTITDAANRCRNLAQPIGKHPMTACILSLGKGYIRVAGIMGLFGL